MRLVKSMYWNNIDPQMVRRQKEALAALGLQVEQCEKTGMAHGIWMDQVLEQLGPQDLVLFLDIDCIPLGAGVVERAFDAAAAGRIFGPAGRQLPAGP